MIDMKQLLVRDHIARLEGEAAAHRAARASNEAPTAGTSTRVRLGRWLVGVGTLIAGTSPGTRRAGRTGVRGIRERCRRRDQGRQWAVRRRLEPPLVSRLSRPMRLGLQLPPFTYPGGAGAIRGTLVEIAQAAAGRRRTREDGRGVLPSRPGRLLLPRSFRPRLTTL